MDWPWILLFIVGNLLLALLIYSAVRKRHGDSPMTLQQAVQSGGASNHSSTFLRTVINGLQDPVLVIDKDFRVAMMNTAAEAASEDLVWQLDKIDCQRMMESLGTPCGEVGRRCALENGSACKHIQKRTTVDGETVPVEIRMTPLINETGEFVGAIEVIHDLNEDEQIALKLRQAKEDAETVGRAKAECVAMMSHEVRTPMNAVLGMADLLQLTALTRKQQDYVRTIQSSGSALLSLVDNVLDYSEMESGELVIRDQPFEVRNFVENILEIMGFQAYSKGLELGCRVEKDVPSWLNGDVDRLNQVMVNLVSNAVRYSNNGDVSICVRTDIDGDGEPSWVCAVKDTGAGIPEDVRARLFDPFTRNNKQEAIGKHGSGLGLTICKWLVEGMGGSINIDSEAGQGTCVTFRLPLNVDESAVTDDVSVVNLDGLRALVMHGNQSMAAIIGEYLSDYGMSWEMSRDGDAGMQRLQNSAVAFDAVIIDASLPGTDGLAMARRIRAESSVADLPIILLTPIAFPLKVGEISSIGGIRCINKPVMPTELLHNLDKSIGVERNPAAAEVAESDVASESGDLRILIAEDNDLSRRLLHNMLASLNYEADTVADGLGALQALTDKAYDVVLMDCQMPGMDGDEVTRRVRSEPDKYPGQPVIVAVTADVSAKHRAECRDAGMDDFLGKPIRRRQLVEGLQYWRADLEYVGDGSDANAITTLSAEKEVREQLQSRAHDESGFLCDYIDLFLDDTNSRLKLLDAASEERDWNTVRRESHALRGACLEMGASAMGKQCVRVQEATDNADASAALHQLRREFDRIQPVFVAAKRHFI